MPDNGPETHGSGQSALKIAVVTGLIGILGIIVGAVAGPVVTKMLTDKPKVPGAPSISYEPAIILYGYTLSTHVEVSNQTVDPIRTYEPLNAEHALSVRPGDTLHFNLSCSIKPNDGNVKLSQLFLAIPGGLKLVEDPRIMTTTVPTLPPPLVVGQIIWAWVDPDLSVRDTAQASFTATVSAEKSTYLTVTWSCPVFMPNQKNILGMSGAVLRVEPS